MKKAITAISIIFCVIIIFFSFFGEKLYYSTKPKVELDRPLRINDLILLPESAIFSEADGDYIFTVESEEGFSTEILTVTKVRLTRCEPDETGYFGDGYVMVEAEDYSNAPTVIRASKPLKDGQRVTEGDFR